MSFQIKDNVCEICGEPASVAMNDKKNQLHYSCFNHVKDLWEKLGKP